MSARDINFGTDRRSIDVKYENEHMNTLGVLNVNLEKLMGDAEKICWKTHLFTHGDQGWAFGGTFFEIWLSYKHGGESYEKGLLNALKTYLPDAENRVIASILVFILSEVYRGGFTWYSKIKNSIGRKAMLENRYHVRPDGVSWYDISVMLNRLDLK